MMETQKGKSVPVVKKFQVEGSWVPTTPVKPTVPHFEQIYENGEVEAYFSRYNQQNQAQTLLSYSITSAETSNINTPSSSSSNINNLWDERINLQRESVEIQKRGLEDYLPHWNNQGRRTKINGPPPVNPGGGQDSNFPYLNSWESSLQWRSNGVRDNHVLGHDHLDQLHNAPMSFGDLLNMNGSAAYLPSWDCNNSAANTDTIFNGSSLFCNQNNLQQKNLDQNILQQQNLHQISLHQNNLHQNNLHPNNLHRYDQQIKDIFGDVQNCASPHPYKGIYDPNSPLLTKQANGKNSTFAPTTPDSSWRIDNNMDLGNTPLGPYQGPFNEQNGLPEQDVAAAMVNLQNVHEEVAVPSTAESPGKASMAMESQNPDDKGEQVIDLNKTPQKKTRRRRYQPKVLSEKKPRRTPKPKTPKVDADSKGTATVKRKYVRKNKVNTPSTPPLEGVAEAGEPTLAPEAEAEAEAEAKKQKGTVKSCKKSLNFDLNGVAAESNMLNADLHTEPQPSKCDTKGDQHGNTVQYLRQEELLVETSRGATAYDLNHESYQEIQQYLSLPNKDPLDISQLRNDVHPGQSPNSSPCVSSNEQEQTRGTKRNHSCIADANAGSVDASNCTFWNPNNTVSRNSAIGELNKIFFPEICKKKRTEKIIRAHVSGMSTATAPSENVNQVAANQNNSRVDPTASKYYCNPTNGVNVVTDDHAKVLMGSVENRVQFMNTWADLERSKKKRSKGTTRVRNLDQLKGIASPLPAKPGPKGPRKKKVNIDGLQPPTPNSIHSCTEALPADSKAKPKSKRKPRTQKSSNQWELVLYNQPTRKATGSFPALPWVNPSSSLVQEITERMRLLDINRESCSSSRRKQNALVLYRGKKQEQNALVVYGKDGTMVPFDGPFNPIKKRRQRAKVELDDETTRVWRLLLENIDNKGIDGSDEDKAKWWENERSVFHGRVDSFIARMRLVQGDRRFTPWKGSVLDSVVGVFLTQNVSDHLSSSAFMSLAAHFPLKSEGSESTLSEESTTALVEEPDVIEPEESITWKTTMDQQLLSSNPTTIHVLDHIEEKEDVNSKEPRAHGSVSPKDCSSESSQKVNNITSKTTKIETATILGDDRAKDDATSSQHPVMSSQNFIHSSNLQTAGMKSIFSENSSRTHYVDTSSQSNFFDCSTPFLELLKMAESPFLHEPYSQIQYGPLQSTNHVTKVSLEGQGICQNGTLLNLKYQLQETKGIEMLDIESRYPDTSRKDENSSPTEQSNLTTESTLQHHALDRSSDSIPRPFAENTSSFYVLEGEKMVRQTYRQLVEPSDNVASSAHKQATSTSKSTNLSQVTTDVTESTTGAKRTSNYQKEIEQISVQTYESGGISNFMNANANKPKKGKAGKGKTDAFDWDSLRREAQADGKVREKTANTRDSLDWEAVRHAHVSEIAETIKERGMNNMLAERIKDLLDRLVKDHGSIDMEWIRDIPPDKAKEYLLSFRGLGLKSVECVRLLTLHHLAFPVDTNVGRIAVRLGWVPLQPLPESLQLHLLELYPILESIQKFLWPRLCKLDQKTLYELHYHLITFGKVFCTKRQPNCNACPLRGECKHFASAFASARFALPGTEEKSIMPSSGTNSANTHPQVTANLLPLPPTWSNQHSHSNSRCDHGPPLLEGSSTPLALPSSQTMNQLERQSENRNCEPIVEVPASPEPEPEREQTLCDIEDTFDDPNEIPTIKLNMTEFTQSIEKFIQANTELQEVGKSNALVALTPEAASIPTPKLKNINRLRTEHHVYELPDNHPLLDNMDKREPDDPSSYLFAIWTPGETADSIQPPERTCNPEDPSKLCNSPTCSACNSLREAESQIVRGTLLIPCRTAMRGSFPLNGTYFQVNEVFADHDSSLNPIAVSRSWLWHLPRRTVYFGTSIPTIFRGLNTEDIQQCFWRGFVCVRGFDQKRRAPRPLMARLHFPASRMPRGTKGC